MTFSVSKTFTFCYGHRLMDDPGRCARIHGHSAQVTITIESDTLDRAGMVCHFDLLKNKIGDWIRDTLDHRMILAKADPMAKAMRDAGEEFVEADFNPTAENLAKMIYDRAQSEGLAVTTVELWESPTSRARYGS